MSQEHEVQFQQQSSQNLAANGEQIASVNNLKITRLWSDEPELWFLHLETVFRARRITSDQTKYDLAVSAIKDINIIRQVSDLIRTPPPTDKYESFKRQLISRLTDSKDRQLDRLLHDLELGQKKPSHLLREMRNLAPASMDDSVLRPIWMSRMPTYVRCVLSASVDVPLANLADIADKIMENSPQTHIMATSNVNPDKAQRNTSPSTEKRLSQIEQSLSELTTAVKALSTSNNRNINLDQRRTRSRSRSLSNSNIAICFFHKKYGVDARKCQKPCAFKSPNVQENSRSCQQ